MSAEEGANGTSCAPDGFDTAATVVAANFPSSSTTWSVGAFFSWHAPVLHVQKIAASDTEAHYCVTFVDFASADRVLETELHYLESGETRRITTKRAAAGTWWS
mmetsp:Transcript_57773/g.135088  ORF Transcript_57773/g.135088 Transcript_57773/m.135088 type:complete len:104 (-) Transcript_57773:34-345(-)